MKTLSKKLLSLMLAVVLLVSVVPFQAMAAVEGQATQFVHVVLNPDKTPNDGEWTPDVDYIRVELTGSHLTDEQRNQINAAKQAAGLTNGEWTVGASQQTSGSKLKDIDFSQFSDEVVAIFPVVAGNTNTPPKHEHSFSTTWSTDCENHWHVCECGEVADKAAHDWNVDKATTETDKHCEICGYVAEEKLEAPEHEHSFAKKTDAANHWEECACGEKKNVEAHNWNVDKATTETDKHCTVCGYIAESKLEETEPEVKEISLMVGDKEYATVKIVDGKVGVLPTAPLKDGYKFTYWYANSNGTGDTLYTGMPESEVDTDLTYHAAFKTSDDDGLGDLTVYAKFYVGSKLKDTVKLYTQKDLQNGTNAFDWLTANKDRTYNAIFSRVDADDYEWEERYYYDYEGKEVLSEQDLKMNGDKSVVVKVFSKHESNVLLYVHRKVSSAAENIYEMGGYVKGDVVSKDAVLSLVKKHYSGSKMTLQGLYTDDAWSQLRNGEKPTAANGITVDTNGTVKIHVLLTNANSTSGGNADSSNPKTGDSIFMTVTVMTVSAIALAGAYLLNKKRMAE